MTAVISLLVVVQTLFGSAATPAAESTPWWQPASGLTWQWQLDDQFVRPEKPVDAYDFDAEFTDSELVQALAGDGIRTICYVNVGSLESWRGDVSAFPARVIGNVYLGWEDERYLDIRQLDILAPIMEARITQCAAKGFDAIEPDNMDAWDADTGFDLTLEDALRYATWLAEKAHAHGLAAAQKNAPELTPDLVSTYDFAITESCAEGNWCDAMTPYITEGKAVLAAEYTDVTSESGFRTMCGEPGLAGMSLIYKHRELDAWMMDCRS